MNPKVEPAVFLNMDSSREYGISNREFAIFEDSYNSYDEGIT